MSNITHLLFSFCIYIFGKCQITKLYGSYHYIVKAALFHFRRKLVLSFILMNYIDVLAAYVIQNRYLEIPLPVY